MTLNDYIGLPYAPCGRGPDGYDCYGLVKAIVEQVSGVELPDWYYQPFDLRGKSRIIDSVINSGTWEPATQPQDGMIAIASRSYPCHIGFVYRRGVIHAQENIGVIYQPLEVFRRGYANVELGTWTP